MGEIVTLGSKERTEGGGSTVLPPTMSRGTPSLRSSIEGSVTMGEESDASVPK